MDTFRIRLGMELQVHAKAGWTFAYTNDGELVMRRTDDDDIEQYVDRDAVIREITRSVGGNTESNDALAWYVRPVIIDDDTDNDDDDVEDTLV